MPRFQNQLRSSEQPYSHDQPGFLPTRVAIPLACLCAVVGLFTIYGTVAMLMNVWRSDDLKSMGMVVPLLCFALIVRSWRSIGWETEGSWWGFAVLAAGALLMFLRDRTLLIVTINKTWLLQLPPLPLVAVVYALGMVLLFGGPRLLRAAWFPVLLIWAVIPVPQTFSKAVDLPLQHASAMVARGFAHMLGEPLTQDKLRLMFTPTFGMFIAPGCNGIRGAITLGLAAVVVGYLYRFRWFVYLPVVAGAVLLGYVFNLLRLCTLVLYYKIALPYPWLQAHAEAADYILGACLFVCALSIFFTVANKLRRDLPADGEPDQAAAREDFKHRDRATLYLARVAAVLLLAAVFGFDALHTHVAEAEALRHPASLVPMPQHVGDYTLLRSWDDTVLGGTVVYTWGEYALNGDMQAPHVSLGISPTLGLHDAEVCHMARDDQPTWHGQIAAATEGGDVNLTAAVYNDGTTQRLEASSVCFNGACEQFSETSKHVTLVYSHTHRAIPMHSAVDRPVPVLLTAESLDTVAPVAVVEPQLQAAVQHFLRGASLINLTAPYSKP
jgi:exosortase J